MIAGTEAYTVLYRMSVPSSAVATSGQWMLALRKCQLPACGNLLVMLLLLIAGLSLAEQSGLKKEDLIEVVKLGAIAAPMFALKVSK